MDEQFSAPPVEGVRFGKYKLIRKLAVGGMAELFVARVSALHGFEKLVALKRILPQYAQSPDFIRMFLAEARLAATLQHPNIAQVYDIGEQDGVFFTMEYIPGKDLRQIVKAAAAGQVPIPLEHVLLIISSVAAGLHHAHTQVGLDGRPLKLVHRDVSPSNVLVSFEGTTKLVDFGIAKAATAEALTSNGTLKGKMPYMSPEQCSGEPVDQRSDIFSLGIVLWELTTGKPLFSATNDFSVLQRVSKADVPKPTDLIPKYPQRLEEIVMRALQRDPDQRYPSALELQTDLEEFAHDSRLPLSATRLSKFMKSLFDEEADVGSMDLVNPNTVIASESSSLPSFGTPSGPGTSISTGLSQQSATAFPISPPRRRRAPLYVAIIGAVAAGAFALGTQVSQHAGSGSARTDPVADGPPVQPLPTAAGSLATPEPPGSSEPSQPSEEKAPDVSDDDIQITIVETETASPTVAEDDPSSKSDKTKRKTSHRRKRDRPSSDKKATTSRKANNKPSEAPSTPPPATKPKWDPNSMLPPGL